MLGFYEITRGTGSVRWTGSCRTGSFGHFWWFHEYFLARKFETIGGFMKLGKKINWNFSGGRLGPRAGAEARGPSRPPEKFQFFFCRVSWIPPMVFKFCCQKYSWIPPKVTKSSMKSRSQNKKNMRGFYWNPALVIFWSKIQLRTISYHSHQQYLFINISVLH